ncbi:hypothetical protein OKW43_003809 [Paraburkholderia sp. WC7.3g]|uniref:hypothetical protein n=1 Tax=Paraburkholderia sp. WC7.3g TaxID=2991070 RepID=UPI003D2077AD
MWLRLCDAAHCIAWVGSHSLYARLRHRGRDSLTGNAGPDWKQTRRKPRPDQKNGDKAIGESFARGKMAQIWLDMAAAKFFSLLRKQIANG